MEDIKYGTKIETEKYYDGKLSTFIQEIEIHDEVSTETILRHIISGLQLKSTQIVFTIKKADDQPVRLTTKYTKVIDKLGRNK